ncbi:MAG: CDP-archaeol synthase [Bacilli bacterium]|nr:CDP-archaeol synthase [Bacilli bacterium]
MRKRIISAAILLMIYAPIIALGGNLFKVGITITGILTFRDILLLIKKENNIPLAIEIISYVLVGGLIISSEYFMAVLAGIFIVMFAPMLLLREKEYSFDAAVRLIMSIILFGYAFSILYNLRDISLHSFIYLALIPILTDTFAFVGGKFLGKHRLMPKVSPNKTIEGTLSGLLAGSLFPTIYYVCFVDQSEKFFDILIVSIILSILGQIGDLVFSAIKRRFNVKDYSNLIPGHGGLLDLFDSLVFVSLSFSIVSMLI